MWRSIASSRILNGFTFFPSVFYIIHTIKVIREVRASARGNRTVFLTNIKGFPLGYEGPPVNINEPMLVEPLFAGVLGKDLEVELLAGDRGFEFRRVFEALYARKVESLVS